MKNIFVFIKDNKRIAFCGLAILVTIANMFGFANYQLDSNVAVVVVAGVTLILSLVRKYYDV